MNQGMQGPASDADIVRFQARRLITLLFKHQLEVLEDLAVEHDNAMAKLEEHLPAEYRQYINLADYLTEARSAQLRKRAIDRGNETIRALEDVLKGFDIKLK